MSCDLVDVVGDKYNVQSLLGADIVHEMVVNPEEQRRLQTILTTEDQQTEELIASAKREYISVEKGSQQLPDHFSSESAAKASPVDE